MEKSNVKEIKSPQRPERASVVGISFDERHDGAAFARLQIAHGNGENLETLDVFYMDENSGFPMCFDVYCWGAYESLVDPENGEMNYDLMTMEQADENGRFGCREFETYLNSEFFTEYVAPVTVTLTVTLIEQIKISA